MKVAFKIFSSDFMGAHKNWTRAQYKEPNARVINYFH